MQIYTTVTKLRTAIRLLEPAASSSSESYGLGLVPTMGALHEGHVSLVRAARRTCRSVAVSIFVNPTQFAPGEDLARYPRTFDADCAMLQREGVDLLFAPAPEEIYPRGSSATFIEVPEISARLDGASRPGHFRGVATVVAKLFNIVQPDVAFFGQKDAAQLAVLRAMVHDLNLPVEMRACPIVRDADGMALSSRNRFLSASERQNGLSLYRSLCHARGLISSGVTASEPLLNGIVDSFSRTPHLKLDYAVIVDPDTLLPVPNALPRSLIAVAAWVGNTRLIDNIVIGDTP